MATENTSTDVVILKLEIQEAGGSSGKTPEKAKKEVDALTTSILGLQQANKKLRDERKLLDTADEKQSARIKEINSQLDKNDKAIKANSSSLEKQRLNVGNYTGALDKLIPGLGATAQGFLGATKAAWAFVATPIGAILAVLALALGAVVKYLTGSEEGMDKFAKISAQVSVVVNVLVDRVIALGGALVAFLSGDFKGGLDKMKGAFSGVGDEIEREIDLAGQLADILDELEERELRYALAVSATKNQIKQLLIESKNRTLSEQDRIKKLDEATALEKKLLEEQLKLIEDTISAKSRQIQMDFTKEQSARKEGETTLDYAKRIAANESILISARQELVDLIVKYDAAQGDSLNLQETIQNKKDALEQKAIEDRVKRDEEEAKRVEEEREKRIEELDLEIESLQYHADLKLEIEKTFLQNREKEIEAATTKGISNVDKILDAQRKRKEVADKKANDAAKKNREDDLKGQEAAINAGTGFLREAFGRNRAIAIAETIINTVRGIVRAIAEYPYPYSAIVGALVGATGTIQTGRIAGLNFKQGGQAWGPKFAKGGYFNLGGNSHAQGGTKFIGSDGTRFEAEKDEGIFVMKREANKEYLSSLNQKHGGKSWTSGSYPAMQKFAQGGQFVSVQSNVNDNNTVERTVKSMMENLPPIYVVAQDVSQVLSTDNEVRSQATVI